MTHSLCAGGQWGGCGRWFVGVDAFDAHRTGDFATRGKGANKGKGKSTRRCMTEGEMRHKGFAIVSSCVKAGQQMPLWGKKVSGQRPAAQGGRATSYSYQDGQSLWDDLPPPERVSA